MVLARIRSTNSSDTFVYHSGNVCYEPYIFSKTKTQHEDENVEDHEGDMMVDIDDVHLRSLQASGTLTETLSSRKNIRETKCIIYDKFTEAKFITNTDLKLTAEKKSFWKCQRIKSMMYLIPFRIARMYTDCMVQIYITILHAWETAYKKHKMLIIRIIWVIIMKSKSI